MISGPCSPWDIGCCCDLSSYSPSITGMAAMAATEVLWAASGRQFVTGCEVVWLPCPETCGDSTGTYPTPARIGGLWYNLTCSSGCSGFCSCNSQDQFTLPVAAQVVSISIAGAPVASGSYTVYNDRFVVRTDGGTWPYCNDGTWLVTARPGLEVPELGIMAAAELACEFAKGCSDDRGCKLPANLSALTRQGVSASVVETASKMLEEGGIGLYLSDLFVRTFNPGALRRRPIVLNPDQLGPRRVST